MLRDRVQCATATTGTGTVTLGAATAGYRTFTSAFVSTVSVSYLILDGDAWETGVGTYDKGANTLTRAIDASSTGAFLALSGSATVSLVFLSREHVPDWPIAIFSRDGGSGGSSFQTIAANGFNTVPITVVEQDSHGGWDAANYHYVVPQAGTYDIDAKVRLIDGTGTGRSYGIGVDIANQDTAGFQWLNTQSNRQGGFNSRTMPLSVGQRIRLFIYSDAYPADVNKAYLRIARVR